MSPTVITIVTAVTVATLTLVMQKTFSNILSGIMMRFSRPFKKGDKVYIKQGAYEVASGHVMKVGLAHTKIKAYNRDVFILSNAFLETCTIVNSDYKTGVNHIEFIRLSIDSNLDKAILIIYETLSKHALTGNNCENTNVICRYQDGGIQVQYNVRTEDVDASYRVSSEIFLHLVKVFGSMDDITII